MPRELYAPAREQVAFREFESEAPGPGQVRVRSLFGAAKHGTEMSIFKGYGSGRGSYDRDLRIFLPAGGREPYPCPLGNMCVGEVAELGPGTTRLGVGDRVFSHGPFREEHCWPETVRRLPDGLPWQAAVCLDPADFALGAVRDGHVRLGDAVAVFGMGAIGLMVVQFALLAGAHPVIAVDPLELRRSVALACGADAALDPAACDPGLEIGKLTGQRGADVCIDFSGHHSGLQGALRSVAYNGTVVAGAFPGPYAAGLDLGAEAHMNRPRLVFSRSNSDPNPDHPNWNHDRLIDEAWRLLASGRLETEAVVQPVVPFDDLAGEYPKIATDPGANVKLGASFA